MIGKTLRLILCAPVRRAGNRHISVLLLACICDYLPGILHANSRREGFRPDQGVLSYALPGAEHLRGHPSFHHPLRLDCRLHPRQPPARGRHRAGRPGVSAWQFLLPACIVGLLVGIVATTVYNPISTELRAISDQLRNSLTEKRSKQDSGPVWIRQAAEGRESIIGALKTSDDGMTLSDVTAFVFDETGAFYERVDAADGSLHGRRVEDRRCSRDETGEAAEEGGIRTVCPPPSLPGQVRQTFDSLDTTSFWELPALIDTARRAGLPSSRYELRYNTLLSRPIVLLAMVLIAAIVSLRFSRSREVGNMILAGVGVGFMLYVVSKIAWDLGSGGLVPPPLAAWLPAIVTVLFGATALLHLEDG